jgi:hypothetical protein
MGSDFSFGVHEESGLAAAGFDGLPLFDDFGWIELGARVDVFPDAVDEFVDLWGILVKTLIKLIFI